MKCHKMLYKLYVMDCGLWIVGYGLWVMDCGLRLIGRDFSHPPEKIIT